MSEVNTGAQDEDPMVRDVTQWLADNPATPEPAGDLVETVARALCVAGHSGFSPDEIMPNDGPRWRYYEPSARAAIAAMPDRAALVGDGTAVAYSNGYQHAAEKFGAELTTLRTQLAASQADVARLSQPILYQRPEGANMDEWRKNVYPTDLYHRGDTVLVWINEGCLYMAPFVRAAIKDTQP